MDAFAAVAALADPVRRRLYEYVVARACPVGREEAADAVDVPVHTARFHLERLVEEGLLATEFRRLSGRTGPGAGRPAKLYSRAATTTVAVSLPPRAYDLAGSVLAAAVVRALAGETLAAAIADEAHRRGAAAGSDYGTRDGAELDQGAELDRTAGLLADTGFEPVLDGETLVLRNCPFDALAQEQPELVCGLNRDYVAGALEGLGCAGLRSRLDPAAGRCCVRVEPDPGR